MTKRNNRITIMGLSEDSKERKEKKRVGQNEKY
jgi:hypothetical protein